MKRKSLQTYCFVGILSILLITVFSCASTTSSNAYPWIEIVEYGIYTSDIISIITSDTSIGGNYDIVKKTTLVRETDSFLLEKEIEFGVWYIVHAIDADKYEIEFIIQHPEFFDIDRGKYVTSTKLTDIVKPNIARYLGCYLDKEYELVPGNWTIEIKYKDQVLAKKIFYIYQ